MIVWHQHFKTVEAIDFAGRMIHLYDTNWNIKKYHKGLDDHVANYYIAHTETIKDCTKFGEATKPVFQSNSVRFQLKKEASYYRFLAT